MANDTISVFPQQPISSSPNEVMDVPNQPLPDNHEDDILRVVERVKELEKYEEETLPAGFYYLNNNLMYLPEPKSEDDNPSPVFICSYLRVLAVTRDIEGNNHGRLLEFRDTDGILKQWPLPMEFFGGTGVEYRKELLSKGLLISPLKNAWQQLSFFIQSCKPRARITCVTNTGWQEKCFVLPDEVFGTSENERLILQTSYPLPNIYSVKGELIDWQNHVSKPCAGNSRLIFAISIAFAGPLLYPLEVESGGFHYFGSSSIGKTTAAKVACSVWGGKDYMQRWRATTNGLEALASAHNDTMLCLDELSQIDPSQAGEAAYMLSHGSGKVRANQYGGARNKAKWRSLFFSTGEIGLAQHMTETGKKTRAGHEVRLVEIPAEAGKHGIFEILNGCENAKMLAEQLNNTCERHYGAAGRAFLTLLVDNLDEVMARGKALIRDILKEHLPVGADGQVGRVLNRFAFVATAGEIATAYGITGWNPGDSTRAAIRCFHDWLKARGSIGPQEEKAILSQVRRFFEQHGESRFTHWTAPVEHKTINRAGFRKEFAGEIEYYVLPETFKTEISAGFEPSFVAKVCVKHGLLLPDSAGAPTQSTRLPGNSRTKRCYRFTSKALGEEDE